jgi:type 1 fimbriae regulatory protein FimB/type 1 fimbriae regulatory protein FimE
MAKSHLKLVAPTEVNRTVTPTRRPNAELRTREHLTPSEVEALIEAAKANRYGQRDATMILLAFRHGLRVAELCDLRWDQVEFPAAVLHVRRVKNGTPSSHPLRGDEMCAVSIVRVHPHPSSSSAERGSPPQLTPPRGDGARRESPGRAHAQSRRSRKRAASFRSCS